MIEHRWDGIEKALKALTDLSVKSEKANVQALNKAIDQVRALTVRAIRSELALPAGYVRDKLRIYGANASRPEATIRAAKRGVLLTRFSHKQLYRRGKTVPSRTAGVRVTITPRQPATFRGGFLVPLKRNQEAGGNGLGLAVRKPGEGKDYEVLHGPSVSQAFQLLRKDIAPQAAEIYRRQYQTALAFALRGSS